MPVAEPVVERCQVAQFIAAQFYCQFAEAFCYFGQPHRALPGSLAVARRRQIPNRRQQQAGEHDQRTDPIHDQAVLDLRQLHSERLQVGLGGDIVVDRVEDLGRDGFGLLASMFASARALVRESRSVRGASA